MLMRASCLSGLIGARGTCEIDYLLLTIWRLLQLRLISRLGRIRSV